MKKLIITLLFFAAIGSITGCAPSRQQQFNNAMAQLQQQMPQLCGKIEDASKTKKAFDIVKCKQDAVANVAQQFGTTVPGFLLEEYGKVMKVAIEFDKGKISKNEMIARVTEIRGEATEKAQALNMQQQQVDAAQQAARAQQMQAYAQQRAANAQAQMAARPVYVQPAPVNNSFHCTTTSYVPGISNTDCQ
jgi:hypothetical protein